MVVLIDLDKTLIDERYNLTDDGIVDAVAQAVGRGHQVGLTSDSPLRRLQGFRERLAMNGPIVAERGAIVSPDGHREVSTGSISQTFFPRVRLRVLDMLMDAGVDAILGDPSEIRRESRYITRKEERPVVLVNALRTHSVHFAAHVVCGAQYRRDKDLLAFVVRCLQSSLEYDSTIGPLEWDVNEEYGIAIIHAAASIKARGMECLCASGIEGPFVVIGDGANDFTGLPWVEHWAVGNASEAYKTQCQRVAHAPYTSGVVELLKHLS